MKSIKIKILPKKDPYDRNDRELLKLQREGELSDETPMYDLPNAPGVFSLGPEHEPVEVESDSSAIPEVTAQIVNAPSFARNFKPACK